MKSDNEQSPTLFNVHLYPTYRILVPNVEARDNREAVTRAMDMIWSSLYDNPKDLDFADECTSAVVDVVGDENFLQTRDFTIIGGEVQ